MYPRRKLLKTIASQSWHALFSFQRTSTATNHDYTVSTPELVKGVGPASVCRFESARKQGDHTTFFGQRKGRQKIPQLIEKYRLIHDLMAGYRPRPPEKRSARTIVPRRLPSRSEHRRRTSTRAMPGASGALDRNRVRGRLRTRLMSEDRGASPLGRELPLVRQPVPRDGSFAGPRGACAALPRARGKRTTRRRPRRRRRPHSRRPRSGRGFPMTQAARDALRVADLPRSKWKL